MAPGKVQYLIVTVEYFTKWVEAKPLATINAEHVKKFIWEFIICRFGLPMEIVSDNGAQFADDKLKTWLAHMGVNQIFTSVATLKEMDRLNASTALSSKESKHAWALEEMVGSRKYPTYSGLTAPSPKEAPARLLSA